VLVATTVLAVGITAGVRALGAMTQASTSAADRATAVRLAAERLAILEAAADATPGTLEVDLADAEGVSPVDPRFLWRQQVAPAPEPGLLEVTVTVSWAEGVLERRYEVTTFLVEPPATEGSDE
jgi:hypothetical protein